MEEQDTPNTSEKARQSRSVTEWCRCMKLGIMHTNFEYLSCSEVEALDNFSYWI